MFAFVTAQLVFSSLLFFFVLPEACLSLQTAAKKFLKANGFKVEPVQSHADHVNLRASCEIDPNCQKILKSTYKNGDYCNFADIMDLTYTDDKRLGGHCTTHGKFCCMYRHHRHSNRISTCNIQIIPSCLLQTSRQQNNNFSCILISCCEKDVSWPLAASYLGLECSIGGPVCMPYSLMGKRLLEDDPRVKTHDSYYSQYKKVCNVFFVENVCEYPPEKVEAALGKEWTVLAVKLDPRNLGLGISRARIYMVCFKKSCVRWNAPFSLEEFIECLASRPILTARNLFWQRVPQHVPTVAQVSWWSFDAASFWLELKVK